MSFTNKVPGTPGQSSIYSSSAGSVLGSPVDLAPSPATIPAVTTSTSGPFASEGSLSFSGGSGLQVNASKFPFNWYTGFTIEAWVNYTSFASALASGVVPLSVGLMQTAGNIADWAFGPNTSGQLRFYYYFTGQNAQLSSNTMTTGTWTHICAQHDGTSFHMYINGVRCVGPVTITGAVALSSTHTYLSFGQYLNSLVPTFKVADVRLVSGANVYPVTGFTAPTTKLTTAPVGTTVFLLQVPLTAGSAILTGRTLFSQLSTEAQNSMIGTYSLRAVNGSSAKAVAVQAHPVVAYPPAALTSNTTVLSAQTYGNGTYTAVASSYNVGGGIYEAWRAFTKVSNWWRPNDAAYNGGTGLYTGTARVTVSGGVNYYGDWLQIQLPNTIRLVTYTLDQAPVIAGGYLNSTPLTFYVFGSNDSGTTWTLIDSQAVSVYLTRTFTVPSANTNTTYNWFRISVNKIPPSTTVLRIAKWILNGSSDGYATGSATDFWADRLGNLSTAAVTGQPLANWLGGSTGYITTWYDQSSAGRNATGTLAIIVPTSDVNQKWAVITTYGGLAVSGGSFLNGTDFTIACTTRRLGTQGNDGVYGYGANTSWVAQSSVPATYGNNTRFALVMPNAGASTISFNDSSYSAAFSSAAGTLPTSYVAATEPVVYTAITFTGASQQMYVNGSTSGTASTTLTQLTANASTGFTIGTVNYYGNFLGEIGELIIFNTALGASDISTLYSAR